MRPVTVWKLDEEVEVLASHDIALLPPYPGPWGSVKSNNKTLTAWACALPVIDGGDYGIMSHLCQNPTARGQAGTYGLNQVRDKWAIEKSIEEWRNLLLS